MEKCFHKLGRIKLAEIFSRLTHPDITDRDFEFIAHRHNYSPLSRTVKFRQGDTGNRRALFKKLCLGNGILAGSRIQNQECLVGSSRDFPTDYPADFFHLLHKIDLGVETAGRIDDQDIALPGQCRLAGVKCDCRRIGAFLVTNYIHSGPLSPYFQLFRSGGTKCVTSRQKNLFPLR